LFRLGLRTLIPGVLSFDLLVFPVFTRNSLNSVVVYFTFIYTVNAFACLTDPF